MVRDSYHGLAETSLVDGVSHESELGAVEVRDTVEGNIRSKNISHELVNSIRQGEEHLRHMAKQAGIEWHNVSPEVFIEWMQIDPNLLRRINFATLSDAQKMEMSRSLWAPVTGVTRMVQHSDAGGPWYDSFDLNDRFLLHDLAFTTAVRERILFDSPPVNEYLRKSEWEKLKQGSLEFECIQNPKQGIEWYKRLNVAGEYWQKGALLSACKSNMTLLSFIQKELPGEYDIIVRNMFFYGDPPHQHSEDLRSFLERAGDMHRTSNGEPFISPAPSPAVRSHSWEDDLFDDRPQLVTKYPDRSRDTWADIEKDEFGMPFIPYQSMDVALGVAQYLRAHPDRMRNPYCIAGQLLATVAGHTRNEVPDEVSTFLLSLLHDPKVYRHIAIVRYWKELFTSHDRAVYENLSQYMFKKKCERDGDPCALDIDQQLLHEVPDALRDGEDASLYLEGKEQISIKEYVDRYIFTQDEVAVLAKRMRFDPSADRGVIDTIVRHIGLTYVPVLKDVISWLKEQHSLTNNMESLTQELEVMLRKNKSINAESAHTISCKLAMLLAHRNMSARELLLKESLLSVSDSIFRQRRREKVDTVEELWTLVVESDVSTEIVTTKDAEPASPWDSISSADDRRSVSDRALDIRARAFESHWRLLAPYMQRNLSEAEVSLKRHLIDPLLASKKFASVLKILVILSRFDPTEARAQLHFSMHDSAFADCMKKAIGYRESLQLQSFERGIARDLATIAFAEVLYPQPERRNLLSNIESDSGLSVEMQSRKHGWILDDTDCHGDAILEQQKNSLCMLLNDALHADVTKRKRTYAQFVSRAALSLRALENWLNAHETDEKRKAAHHLHKAFSVVQSWAENGRDHPDSIDTAAIFLALKGMGIRPAYALDSATPQEKRMAAMPFALARDFEAKAGYAWVTRRIPLMEPEALANEWYDIVIHGKYPQPQKFKNKGPSQGDHEATEAEGEPESGELERERTMEELRDSLLSQLDNPVDPSDQGDCNEAHLPFVGELSSAPKLIAQLSEAMEGDAQYFVDRICMSYDPKWCAHKPSQESENLDLRTLMHHTIEEGKEVLMTLRAKDGMVIPHSCGTDVTNASMSVPGAGIGWGGHWSRRVRTTESGEATIVFKTPTLKRKSNGETLRQVLEALPESLKHASEPISKQADLPPEFEQEIERLRPLLTTMPLENVVDAVRDFVQQRYVYSFITQNPEYKERYRQLLQQMPYVNRTSDAYLDFIHSLRKEGEFVLGRGMCGQLSTVLMALRHLGIPSFFATGYATNTSHIDTNHGHAFILVPLLDQDGKIFLKPKEATSGNIEGVMEVLHNAPRVAKENTANVDVIFKEDTHALETSTFVPEVIEQWILNCREHFRRALNLEVSPHDLYFTNVLLDTVIEMRRQRLTHPTNEQKNRVRSAQNIGYAELVALPTELPSFSSLLPDGMQLAVPGQAEIIKNICDGSGIILTSSQQNLLEKLVTLHTAARKHSIERISLRPGLEEGLNEFFSESDRLEAERE